jgi:hypothetical protein
MQVHFRAMKGKQGSGGRAGGQGYCAEWMASSKETHRAPADLRDIRMSGVRV